MTLPLLPDVNVWIALHHQVHLHHKSANKWFESLDPHDTLVFCRQTQMGFFRLLTTEAVMGDEALTQRRCWDLYWRWMKGGRAAFCRESAAIEEAFQLRTMGETASPKEWMDAYLAAYAECSGLTLVTFDRALASKAVGSVLLS